jgi:hypothetical protein
LGGHAILAWLKLAHRHIAPERIVNLAVNDERGARLQHSVLHPGATFVLCDARNIPYKCCNENRSDNSSH